MNDVRITSRSRVLGMKKKLTNPNSIPLVFYDGHVTVYHQVCVKIETVFQH